MNGFLQRLRERPVIAAVRDMQGARLAAQSQASVVFLLGGTILQLPEMVQMLKQASKAAFLHVDLIEGLGRDAAAVAWCAQCARPDGLISTRAPLLKAARGESLLTIQRLFVTDSSALAHGIRQIQQSKPDMLEILPGLLPKVIAELRQQLQDTPIIAGGLVTAQPELEAALGAGAIAVSTSEPSLWNLESRIRER